MVSSFDSVALIVRTTNEPVMLLSICFKSVKTVFCVPLNGWLIYVRKNLAGGLPSL